MILEYRRNLLLGEREFNERFRLLDLDGAKDSIRKIGLMVFYNIADSMRNQCKALSLAPKYGFPVAELMANKFKPRIERDLEVIESLATQDLRIDELKQLLEEGK